MFCKKCGAELKGKTKFCEKCGSKRPRKKWITVLLIVLISIISIAIAIGIVIFVKDMKDLRETNENVTNLYKDQTNNNAKKDSLEEKMKSYLQNNVSGINVKSITIIPLKDDMYDVELYYEKNIVYLHICAEDSQIYARDLLETNNTLNNNINSLKLICKENGTVKYNVDISNFNNLTKDTIESNTTLKDNQGNNIDKTVSQVKAEYINEYKNSCQTYDYKTIYRYAEDYKGKDVKYTGKVVQVIEDDLYTSYRVNVTKDKWGYYDDTIYVTFYDLGGGTPRILEDDIITFYGTLGDLYTYETVVGTTVTIPSVFATYIDLVE